MAMICKRSEYAIDPTAESIEDFRLYNCFYRHTHAEVVEVKDWNENHVLNDPHVDLSYCERYFYKPAVSDPAQRAIVLPGQKWRHFKVGKVVEVLAVSIDTECPTQRCVVYKAPDGVIWHRPLDMFLSPVDKEKYPESKQEWRFELVKE